MGGLCTVFGALDKVQRALKDGDDVENWQFEIGLEIDACAGIVSGKIR